METNLSDKQLALQDYLLQKLGFTKDEYLDIFLDQLSKYARYHILIAGIEKDENYNDWRNPQEIPYFNWTEKWNLFLPYKFGVIDLLMQEYKLKKNLSFKKLAKTNSFHSATDLSNFKYCEIGYAISKTYEGTRNTLAETGTVFHEKKLLDKNINDRLIFQQKDRKSYQNPENDTLRYINDTNAYFFDDIAGSDLLYSGHTEEERKKYFINEEKRFIGQPDYIFKNFKGESFVVEEKFKNVNDGKIPLFSSGHKIQLASYIQYIKEYKIKYGYLVYWTYRKTGNYDGNPEDCYILKINNNITIEAHIDILIQRIEEITSIKEFNIDTEKLNPLKCASCVHVVICGHKNRRYNKVTIPYSEGFFKLAYAPYPEILKK